MSEIEKRTHIYVLQPREYEISGCPCGNEDPGWSEFKHHLWCEKCQKDFIPESNGVFDGPIPVNACHMMGLCFAEVNLAERRIEIHQFSKAEEDCPYCKNATVIPYVKTSPPS